MKKWHPNPYFERENFQSLNGFWDFAYADDETFLKEFKTQIRVPFAPETSLSGIKKTKAKSSLLHYRRSLVFPSSLLHKKILLHFLAVDQIADIYWNRRHVFHHEGGYLPFFVPLEVEKSINEIYVIVRDDIDDPSFMRGKQSKRPGGIFYQETSGIWQDVYYEVVPDDGYVTSFQLSPIYEKKSLKVNVAFEGKINSLKISIYHDGEFLFQNEFATDEALIDFRDFFHEWSTDDPYLYEVLIEANDDKFKTIFGFRKIEILVRKDGKKVFALNGKPLLLRGLLDQGYWSDGGMTPPSQEALIFDIKYAKEAGFNLLRKHIKIEHPRFYYYCDLMGILVMQDFVNSGSQYSKMATMVAPFLGFNLSDHNNKKLGRGSLKSRSRFESDMEKTIDYLKKVTSLVSWTLFNEGWGQYDTERLLQKVRELDSTRLVDASSGWFDKRVGDFKSEHIYFKPLKMRNDGQRLLALSEFGGYSCRIKGHLYSSKSFGYRMYKNIDLLEEGLRKIYAKLLLLIEKEALTLYVYTQLNDVEEEVNGLLTYDREIKISAVRLAKLNRTVNIAFANSFKGEKL